MKQFGYARAESVEQALNTLTSTSSARYLGGGTNLIDLMKLGVLSPDLLVDVRALPLDQITEQPDGSVRIGAAVTNSDLAVDPLIRQRFPAVSQAVLAGASGQLRNVATVGGNLMQQTRCSYFMDVSKPCNRRAPGTGCPARTGEHHNHAILGASEHCIATSPSDLAVPLAAFDAQLVLHGSDGESTVPISEFYRLPGDQPDQLTTVADGTLVVGVLLPASDLAGRSRYRKVRERASYAFAIGSVAAAISVTDGVIGDARLAWGAVAAVPWRARLAERALIGQPASTASFRAAAQAELAHAEPLTGNSYKVELLSNLTVEVLTELVEASA
ncbi:MAG: xanthine dehydrogenase family protein subunit M [Jatrophihabitantaceae bacterium]